MVDEWKKNKMSKQKTCSFCGVLGHNKITCKKYKKHQLNETQRTLWKITPGALLQIKFGWNFLNIPEETFLAHLEQISVYGINNNVRSFRARVINGEKAHSHFTFEIIENFKCAYEKLKINAQLVENKNATFHYLVNLFLFENDERNVCDYLHKVKVLQKGNKNIIYPLY